MRCQLVGDAGHVATCIQDAGLWAPPTFKPREALSGSHARMPLIALMKPLDFFTVHLPPGSPGYPGVDDVFLCHASPGKS